MTNTFSPYEAKDFMSIDVSNGNGTTCYALDERQAQRFADIANGKFHKLMEDWVPSSLMKQLGEQKNDLETQLRGLQKELTKLKEWVEKTKPLKD